jgi:hypothetical protein
VPSIDDGAHAALRWLMIDDLIWDLARVPRERDPAFPVVYMTGTTAEDGARLACPTAFFSQSRSHLAQLVTAVRFSMPADRRLSDPARRLGTFR